MKRGLVLGFLLFCLGGVFIMLALISFGWKAQLFIGFPLCLLEGYLLGRYVNWRFFD